MMGDTGSKSSGNASEGRRLTWERENNLEGNALTEAGLKLIFFLDWCLIMSNSKCTGTGINGKLKIMYGLAT